MRRKRHEAQARSRRSSNGDGRATGRAPVGVSEPEERDVVPWLRRLGFNMRESRSAATLCADFRCLARRAACARH